jgi:hypothetical protein
LTSYLILILVILDYLINQILYLNWDNYFYGLLAITCVWMLEIAFPWRKNKPFFFKKILARFILYVFQFFPIESDPCHRAI